MTKTVTHETNPADLGLVRHGDRLRFVGPLSGNINLLKLVALSWYTYPEIDELAERIDQRLDLRTLWAWQVIVGTTMSNHADTVEPVESHTHDYKTRADGFERCIPCGHQRDSRS